MNKHIVFYLARHGQTEWNLEHRIQGQLDSELTQLGKQQALQLAVDCQHLNITRVLTSPLGRAEHTARICAAQLQVEVEKVAGFEERNFGHWQGKLTSEVDSHPQYTEMISALTDCKPELGESANQALSRFKQTLMNQLEKSPNDNLLVIAHGEILRCLISSLPESNKAITGYDFNNGQILALSYDVKNKQFFRSC